MDKLSNILLTCKQSTISLLPSQCVILPVLINIEALYPRQLFIYCNKTTCLVHLYYHLHAVRTAFKKGKYAHEVCISLYVRFHISKKFSCFILLCHLAAVVYK